MKYTVYCLTINGKKYVGYTHLGLETRMARHVKNSDAGVETHLYRAIRKYGSANLTGEVLVECQTSHEARENERKWIRDLDTFRNGYNMTQGGDGGNTKEKYSEEEMEEWRKLQSESCSGMKNGNAKPDVTNDVVLDCLTDFIVKEDRIDKNVLKSELQNHLKSELRVSEEIVKRRFGSFSTMVNELNTRMMSKGIGKTIYDPYYRGPDQRKKLSDAAAEYGWVTDGETKKMMKKDDMTVFISENPTFRRSGK